LTGDIRGVEALFDDLVPNNEPDASDTVLSHGNAQVIGMCADPLGVLLCSLELLDTTHPNNNTVFGSINYDRRSNMQRLQFHLLPEDQACFATRKQQRVAEALRRILKRVVATVCTRNTSFSSLSSWLLLLIKAMQVHETAQRHVKRYEGNSVGERGNVSGGDNNNIEVGTPRRVFV
jgi:hypothetical protein